LAPSARVLPVGVIHRFDPLRIICPLLFGSRNSWLVKEEVQGAIVMGALVLALAAVMQFGGETGPGAGSSMANLQGLRREHTKQEPRT
jgi:hypothetical protein